MLVDQIDAGRVRSDRRRARRLWRWIVAAILLAIIALVAHPVWHIGLTLLTDHAALPPVPQGFVDDASRMNLTAVSEVIPAAGDPAEAGRQIAALLARARTEGLKVSIGGSRHTMGGHTIYPGGISLDMRPLNHVELDKQSNILRVGAGASWSQIIPFLDQRGRSIEIMQSNNSFTVGGSISANCHGWQPGRPPIASSVESFRLMLADSTVVQCSRRENAELFSLVLGGYGLFGVILDVDLHVVPNERYRAQRLVIDAGHYAEVFEHEVRNNAEVGLAYGRLRVTADHFLEQAIVNVFVRSPCAAAEMPVLTDPTLTSLKRAVFRGSAGSDYGKELRWDTELALSDRLAQSYVSRNLLLNDPVELYQNRDDATTDILQEYFVPPESFAAFVDRMRGIIPRHHADLLNVTVRHVLKDEDSFLRYADREMLSLVLLFDQPRTPEGDRAAQSLTMELIDAALELGGRYYLPYRLHATQEQFQQAYPQAQRFFELKRKYDPDELFQNQFYLKYGVSSEPR